MPEIVKIKSASYKRYEELLQKKEALLKEAEQYRLNYERIFDELIRNVYDSRLECVKKRKVLSYCKSIVGQGNPIIKGNLDAFVDKAMQDYKDTLDYLNGFDKDKHQKKNVLNQDDQKKIKLVYHQLAKLIHPDMNSELRDNQIIRDLWNRICIAYDCSNLDELQELQVLVNKYLESMNQIFEDVDIPDINEKIFNLNRQIYEITHTNPYQYRYIIENEDTINRKKEELNKELADYQRYICELDKEIAVFETLIEEE